MEQQRNEQMELLKQEDQDVEEMIFTEENKRNLEDMKQLNQVNLTEIIPEKQAEADSAGKADGGEEETKKEAPVEGSQTTGLSIVTTKDAVSAQQTKQDYLD